MKRILMITILGVAVHASVSAMSYREARREALYLTDKMAYELGLSDEEYDEVYRINLNYLRRINTYDDAYTSCWDYRNSALRAIFTANQWGIYVNADAFYRPVSWRNGGFYHRIYSRYPDRSRMFYHRSPDMMERRPPIIIRESRPMMPRERRGDHHFGGFRYDGYQDMDRRERRDFDRMPDMRYSDRQPYRSFENESRGFNREREERPMRGFGR